MRMMMVAMAGLALAACSSEPTASKVELDDFEPPVVGVRGNVVPRQQARFSRLDKNTDGFITPDEYPEQRRERIARFDTDRDGKVSRSELVEGVLNRFDALDADKDGQVTPEERRAGAAN